MTSKDQRKVRLGHTLQDFRCGRDFSQEPQTSAPLTISGKPHFFQSWGTPGKSSLTGQAAAGPCTAHNVAATKQPTFPNAAPAQNFADVSKLSLEPSNPQSEMAQEQLADDRHRTPLRIAPVTQLQPHAPTPAGLWRDPHTRPPPTSPTATLRLGDDSSDTQVGRSAPIPVTTRYGLSGS